MLESLFIFLIAFVGIIIGYGVMFFLLEFKWDFGDVIMAAIFALIITLIPTPSFKPFDAKISEKAVKAAAKFINEPKLTSTWIEEQNLEKK